MTQVHLGKNLKVPAVELATQVVAALGMRGSGKSNSMAVIVEGLLLNKVQTIVLDYVGIWFGLRLAPTGRSSSGFDIPVMGGRHGDIPLLPTAGALVARALAETGSPAVLDISAFSKADRQRFATDFAEALFVAKKEHSGPTFLVLEEAQRFVPQKLFTGQERMLGAFEEIAEVGRNYGLGLGLISQRPQKISKDVLNLTELLLAFQTNGVLERKAIAEWVQEKGAEGRKEVNDELPSLHRGEALVWSPSWLRIYGRYPIDKKTTYDAGATPIGTRAAVKTKHLALPELSQAMAQVVEETKANDPRALRAEVTRLRRELEASGKARPPAPKAPRRIEVKVPIVPAAVRADIKAALVALAAMEARLTAVLQKAEGLPAAVEAAPRPAAPAPAPRARAVPTTNGVGHHRDDEGPRALSRAARAMLAVLAQRPASSSQLSILTGYSGNSSTFANALGELRSGGLVAGSRDRIEITEPGRTVAEAVAEQLPPLPQDGPGLLAYWQAKLGRAERIMLGALYEHRELTKDQLAEITGYSGNSSTFANAIGTLRSLELAMRGDPIRIAETFS